MSSKAAMREAAEEADRKLREMSEGNTESPEEEEEPLEAEAEPQETPPVKAEPWEERYRVLQGKYDAEVPRLHEQVKYLTAQLDALNAQRQPPAKQTESDYLAKIREDYGDELAAPFEQLQAELVKLRNQMSQVGQTREQMYYQSLDTQVPDWQALNNDPGFLSWLDQVSPDTGVRRKEALDDAHRRLDAGRVGMIFKAYQAAQAKPVPSAPKSVTPNSSRANPSTSSGGPTVKMSDYKRFADAVTKGVYRNRPEERLKLERMYEAALRDGRIAP